MLLRTSTRTSNLVTLREALDWLRLPYGIYNAGDFWTQAEIDDPVSGAPQGAVAGNPKPGIAAGAVVGNLYDYDEKVDDLVDIAENLVERHGEISIEANQTWRWTKNISRGSLLSAKSYNRLDFPITPVTSVQHVQVFSWNNQSDGYEYMNLPSPDDDEWKNDYYFTDAELYINKRWEYKTPSSTDAFIVNFTTGAGNLIYLKQAALRIIAYLYEHAGDEIETGNVVMNSGAWSLLAQASGNPKGLFAL